MLTYMYTCCLISKKISFRVKFQAFFCKRCILQYSCYKHDGRDVKAYDKMQSIVLITSSKNLQSFPSGREVGYTCQSYHKSYTALHSLGANSTKEKKNILIVIKITENVDSNSLLSTLYLQVDASLGRR